jgi:hypothetical protein
MKSNITYRVVLATIATLAPSAAALLPIHSPIPLDAPDINSVLPAKLPVG